MNDPSTTEGLTLAAIGDLHVSETSTGHFSEMFARVSEEADGLALCGALTNSGKPAEIENLLEDFKACSIPTVAVLGNHDYEAGQAEEVVAMLRDAGITVLD